MTVIMETYKFMTNIPNNGGKSILLIYIEKHFKLVQLKMDLLY